MKRILVPTDFSIQAERALRVAAQLARKHDCKIYLMHLIKLPPLAKDSATEGEEPPEKLVYLYSAREKFEEILERDYLQDIEVEETVEFRNAFDGIIEGSDKYDIDLVVMGSAGSTELRGIHIGSNTEKVVRHSNVPVLVIKKEIEDFEVDDFVYATDLEMNGLDAFGKAIEIAALFNANLHLVFVNTPDKFNTTRQIDEKMEAFFEDIDEQISQVVIYNEYSIEKGILNYAKEVDAQLMGIATNGRKGLAHILNGSISEGLANHAENPVITFKI